MDNKKECSTGFSFGGRVLRDRLEFKNGITVSAQADCAKYCLPRDNCGPYTHVELGFPSEQPPSYIMEYAECSHWEDDCIDPVGMVYGYVPVSCLIRWIAESGGLKEGASSDLV